MIDINKYSFCEPVWAGSLARWCVRPLTDKGRKVTGGVDTASLCGRVDPAKGGGWDLSAECTISLDHRYLCARCKQELQAILGVKSSPEGQ